MTIVRIDARGQRCPWPAIRLARALREPSDMIEIIADDPAAAAELASVAAAAAASMVAVKGAEMPTFRIQRGAIINNSFTRDL